MKVSRPNSRRPAAAARYESYEGSVARSTTPVSWSLAVAAALLSGAALSKREGILLHVYKDDVESAAAPELVDAAEAAGLSPTLERNSGG
jgi:hypothetical protein